MSSGTDAAEQSAAMHRAAAIQFETALALVESAVAERTARHERLATSLVSFVELVDGILPKVRAESATSGSLNELLWMIAGLVDDVGAVRELIDEESEREHS